MYASRGMAIRMNKKLNKMAPRGIISGIIA
jgi:hypothetical protein